MICLSINDGWKDIHAKQIYVDLPDLKCFILNLSVVLQMNDIFIAYLNYIILQIFEEIIPYKYKNVYHEKSIMDV